MATKKRSSVRPVPVLRLSITYLKTGWEVVGHRRIKKMVLPQSHPRPISKSGIVPAGSWFEVLGRDGRLIYRRRVPLTPAIEFYGEDGSPGTESLPDAPREPVDLLLPDDPDLAELALYDCPVSRRTPGKKEVPLVPVAVFALQPARRRGDRS